MGVGLGAGASLSWGLPDYFAALAGRTVGAQRVVVGFCLLAAALLAIVVLPAGGLGPVDAGRLAVFVAVGGVGWLSYLAFYRVPAVAPISVLSPICLGLRGGHGRRPTRGVCTKAKYKLAWAAWSTAGWHDIGHEIGWPV